MNFFKFTPHWLGNSCLVRLGVASAQEAADEEDPCVLGAGAPGDKHSEALGAA